MDTQEIYASLKTNESTKDCFENVYPSDKLPKKSIVRYNSKGQSFIVANLDPSYMQGSHWVALCISPSKYCADEYFDSYGEEPPASIKKYLKERYIFQKQQLQSFTSTVCGQWCIYYIWQRCNGLSMKDIILKFKDNSPEENDKYINYIVNENFSGKDHVIQDFDFFEYIQSSQRYKDYHFTT